MAAERKEKPKKKTPVNWKKIGAVVIGVFFVVVMVVSTLGVGWINSFTSAKNGDTVLIDFTMYSEDGRPVVTTNQQTVNDGANKGLMIFLAQPMQMTVGAPTDSQLIPIRVNHKVYGWTDYTFFANEINAIQKSLVGAKTGEVLDVKIPSTYMLERQLTGREYGAMGGNLSGTRYGDQLVLGFSDAPSSEVSNSTKPRSYVRVAYISRIDADNLTVNYGAKSINTVVRSIKSTS